MFSVLSAVLNAKILAVLLIISAIAGAFVLQRTHDNAVVAEMRRADLAEMQRQAATPAWMGRHR